MTMATALALPQPTLYELEDTLQALVNSIDLAEEPSAREAILDDIGQSLRRTKEKRDAVVAFLRHCEVQQKFADSEIDRIQRRKAFIARVQQELESYVVGVVEQYAPRDRRSIQRLEGNFSCLRIQRNPESVVISDVEAVPAKFKTVVVSMPALLWKSLVERFGDRAALESEVERQEFKPDKKAIAAELKRGGEIPGADLKFGDWRLVIT